MTTRNGYDAHSRTQRLPRVRDIIPDREPKRSDASVLIDFDPHLPVLDPRGPDPHGPGDWVHTPQDRAQSLVENGRANAYSPGLSSKRKLIIVAALAGVLSVILTVVLASGGASWPASVARVQAEAAKACRNPDVRSEPNQINFACAKGTTAILWVFALLTSG